MSEFGTGFSYCLGLFLAHAERIQEMQKSYKNIGIPDDGASLWFNGAADHLYGLEVPNILTDEKKAEIAAWRESCLNKRIYDCTWDDAKDAIQYAKDTLLMWDEVCGIKCKKGNWE